MISPYRIKYAGIASNELNIPDLITCVAMDSDNGESPSFLNRESVASESYDGRYKRIHRLKYTETFSPKITLMKPDFKDFSMEDVRAVLKWLTMKDTTALLEVFYDDSEVVSWASIGGFIDLQTYKLANNRTIAITATWDSISPFALSDLYTVTKTISSPTDNKITIDIDTDDNKPVCPRVTIRQKGLVVDIPANSTLNALSDMVENTIYFNGSTYYWKSTPDEDGVYFHVSKDSPNITTTSVRLSNIHTDFFGQRKPLGATVIKNNTSDETIVLDGANKIISSDRTRRIFGDDFEDWHWLELYDGKNEIVIEGNCEVKLEWREVRKIGEY